ncbi:MAG: S-layer protein domain-containing protein, partial [Methanosarcinaceae archaeon]|nr:S-layer protein domain-containing protein [Methanosarcinaceae archaeon]
MKIQANKLLTGLLLLGLFCGLAMAVPNQITGLDATKGETWIHLTWTNPGEANFSSTDIYVDSTFEKNILTPVSEYNITGLTADNSYNIGTRAVDTGGNFSAWENKTFSTNAPPAPADITPPATITGLSKAASGNNWIRWTWTNPTDADFKQTIVYINGVFENNVPNTKSEYNATGLNPGTSYNISTNTEDDNGNINNTWVNNTAITGTPDGTAPASITDLKPDKIGESWILWTWKNPIDPDYSYAEISVDGKTDNVNSPASKYNATGLSGDTLYNISIQTVDSSGNKNTTVISNETRTLTDTSAPANVTDLKAAEIETNSIKWTWTNPNDPDFNHTMVYIGNDFKINTTDESYTANNLTADTEYTIKLRTVDKKGNINVIQENTASTRSKYYSTGNRIWEDGAGLSNVYIWNPQSYSGFYYDLDSGEGSETMTITLEGKSGDVSRTIEKGELVYETTPIKTDFEYKNWGKYEVIGFMAEKYFAGYIDSGNNENKTTVGKEKLDANLISEGVLAKVLIDSDEETSIYSDSDMFLEDGYSLNIVEVDVNGEKVWVQLEKDGDVVEDQFLSSDSDFIYEADLGDAEDVPIIIVHFGTVFAGREASAVYIEGIFQISDNYIEIESGKSIGEMEVKTVNDDLIKMENDDDISLKKGKTIDIMGKLQIVVADDDVLRFAPIVEMSEAGTYELRGTVFDEDKNPTAPEWTYYNFEGFYYDIDEGLGT